MIRSPQNETEWKAYYELRYEVLRAPWGQAKGSEQTPDEALHQHFAFFNDDNQIIGVGRLDQIDAHTAQIRFMAVEAPQQSKGIGKCLIHFMETEAKQKGNQQIILHAREVALPFYQKLGYHLDNPSHLLFGEIQHFLMHKLI
jgi:N-acetylglutamate synthase-like GNAT family acetyltransferase